MLLVLLGSIRSLPLRTELCCPAAVRRPGYLPGRRFLGFAPPPHDGFAFLASAWMRVLGRIITKGDEFAMNCEAVSVSFSAFLLFLETFCELGANFAENVARPSGGT